MLELHHIKKAFGGIIAVNDLSLKVNDSDFFVLLGPSGCGKTTLIRLIAGLEAMDSGQIIVDQKDWSNLRPQERNIALVFQHYALYPHRSVRGNIEYPLRLRGLNQQDRKLKVRDVSELLGISSLLDRKPKQLSGGEAQRVALARALVREPSFFLMDEPLSNLDAQLRVRARAEIKRIQRDLKVTTIYVTHDQEEALALGDRIALMDKGRLIQVGTREELFKNPNTVFVAGFLGKPPMNLLEGTVTANESGAYSISFKPASGSPLVMAGIRQSGLSMEQKVTVGIRPHHLKLLEQPTQLQKDEIEIPCEIELVEGLEPELTVHCLSSLGPLLIRTHSRPSLGAGRILLQSKKVHLFDTKTGNRIE